MKFLLKCWSRSNRFMRRFNLRLVLFCGLIILQLVIQVNFHRDSERSAGKFSINTEGCKTVALDAYAEEIYQHVSDDPSLEVLQCPPDIGLLSSNDTHIWIKETFFTRTNFTDFSNIKCCYKPFHRPSKVLNIESFDVDHRVLYSNCSYFTREVKVADEFVKVFCKFEGRNHTQYFIFAPKKKMKVMHRLKNSPEITPAPQYNVIILGLSRISRYNFRRTMPRMLTYLKNKGAVELRGYSKVGLDAFANLVPLLIGYKNEELKKLCWPHKNATFDNCPFIWYRFKNMGYYTAYADDFPMVSTFNVRDAVALRGFMKSPTDYYAHTFIKEADDKVGNSRDQNPNICMGSIYFYKVLLSYILKLTRSLGTSKLFGFFWEASMTYDYANYPGLIDFDYVDLLENLEVSKYLEKTVVIVLSEQGLVWTEARNTHQGRIEERRPTAFILLPKSFRKNYTLAYKNLIINSRKLTTAFDMHATLNDLANLTSVTDKNIKLRIKTIGDSRSISLFLAIPGNRTCKTVDIDEHWCPCEIGKDIRNNKKFIDQAVEFVIEQINLKIAGYDQCTLYVMSEILEAKELYSKNGSRYYSMVLMTLPGDSEFYAKLKLSADGIWDLVKIVRTSVFNYQSRCMDQTHLKPFCYCGGFSLLKIK